MGLNQQPHRSFGRERQKDDAQERAKSEPREAEHVEHGHIRPEQTRRSGTRD
jgi:hypothetical protein